MDIISRSNSNQTMEFGQLIEHNMRNMFVEKSYSKLGVRSVNFSIKLRVSLDPYVKSFMQFVFCFYCMSS